MKATVEKRSVTYTTPDKSVLVYLSGQHSLWNKFPSLDTDQNEKGLQKYVTECMPGGLKFTHLCIILLYMFEEYQLLNMRKKYTVSVCPTIARIGIVYSEHRWTEWYQQCNLPVLSHSLVWSIQLIRTNCCIRLFIYDLADIQGCF